MKPEEISKLLEAIPKCEKCESGEFRIAYRDVILTGCDEHIVEIVEHLKKDKFFQYYKSFAPYYDVVN